MHGVDGVANQSANIGEKLISDKRRRVHIVQVRAVRRLQLLLLRTHHRPTFTEAFTSYHQSEENRAKGVFDCRAILRRAVPEKKGRPVSHVASQGGVDILVDQLSRLLRIPLGLLQVVLEDNRPLVVVDIHVHVSLTSTWCLISSKADDELRSII